MKRALYLHGFLGGPGDMRPLFLNGYECESFDLRKILNEEDPVGFLANSISQYDFILGYSFGGRILEELQDRFPDKTKKCIFVSSRHTPYSLEELKSRDVFRSELWNKLEDRPSFFQFWRELPLFNSHDMDCYRARYKIAYVPWTNEQIKIYLEKFFNSIQVKPKNIKGAMYLHGRDDEKYFAEGLRLKIFFSVYEFDGGHRFLFEDIENFKTVLLKMLEDERSC